MAELARQPDLLEPPGPPEDMRDWFPDEHPALAVSDAFDALRGTHGLTALCAAVASDRDGGGHWDPLVLSKLLFYGRINRMTAGAIARAVRTDVAFRFLAAGSQPDEESIEALRSRHTLLLAEVCLQVGPLVDELIQRRRREVVPLKRAARAAHLDRLAEAGVIDQAALEGDRHAADDLERTAFEAVGSQHPTRVLEWMLDRLIEPDADVATAIRLGPLPAALREAILEVPRAAVAACRRMNLMPHAAFFVDLAPVLVIEELCDTTSLYSDDAIESALCSWQCRRSLMERICAFATRVERVPNNATSVARRPTPSSGEFHGAFGADAPIVESLWPEVSFLVALHGATSTEEEVAIFAELTKKARVLASIKLGPGCSPEALSRSPKLKEDPEGALFFEIEQLCVALPRAASRVLFGRTGGIVGADDVRYAFDARTRRIANRRHVDEGDLLGRAFLLHEKVQAIYTPSGNPEGPLAYMTMALRHDLRREKMRMRGRDYFAPEERGDPHEERSASKFEEREISPQSYSKHRKRLLANRTADLGPEWEPSPAEVVESIDRGLSAQSHRSGGDDLTRGQFVEEIIKHYDISRRDAYYKIAAAVEDGAIVPRPAVGRMPGKLLRSDLAVLEDRLRKGNDSELSLKDAFEFVDRYYEGVKMSDVRRALEAIRPVEVEETGSGLQHRRADVELKHLEAWTSDAGYRRRSTPKPPPPPRRRGGSKKLSRP
jgi:hypothetical protein